MPGNGYLSSPFRLQGHVRLLFATPLPPSGILYQLLREVTLPLQNRCVNYIGRSQMFKNNFAFRFIFAHFRDLNDRFWLTKYFLLISIPNRKFEKTRIDLFIYKSILYGHFGYRFKRKRSKNGGRNNGKEIQIHTGPIIDIHFG